MSPILMSHADLPGYLNILSVINRKQNHLD